MKDTDIHQSDDLERHLRASLREYAPEAPERLWSGIEERLSQHRRRPVLLFWLTGVGMVSLMTGVVYLLFYYNWNFREIQDTASNSSKWPASVSRVLRSLPAEHHREVWVEKFGNSDQMKVPQARSSDPNLRATVRDIAGRDAGEALNSEQTRAGAKRLRSDKMSAANAIPENARPEPVVVPAKNALPSPESLPGRRLLQLKNDEPVVHVVEAIINTSRKRPWQIGATAGPVWLWHPALPSDVHHGGHIAFSEQNEGPSSGWQAGISVHFALTPRWRVSTGFEQRTAAQTASHRATLRLIDGICINPNDNGPKEYEFVYALISSRSAANVTVRIAQVDNHVTMPDDEPFTLSMRTTNHRSEWVLPLALERTFGRGRWRGFVQAGGQLVVPASDMVQVDHFTEQCADLCFAAGRIPTLIVQTPGNASLAWIFGAGLEYHMTSQWALSIEPKLFGERGRTGLSLNTGMNFRF